MRQCHQRADGARYHIRQRFAKVPHVAIRERDAALHTAEYSIQHMRVAHAPSAYAMRRSVLAKKGDSAYAAAWCSSLHMRDVMRAGVLRYARRVTAYAVLRDGDVLC